MSVTGDPFRKLVKLVARAFYDDEIPIKSAVPGKPPKAENRGIAVVVLDALTRRQWVKEEELAKNLKLHSKQLRRTLRILEDEMLIVREDRKETVKGAKVYNAAVALTSENAGLPDAEKTKVMIHSYCCIDYAQVYDVVRYRIHRAKKMIKDQLEDKNTIQEYLCPEPSCGRRYTALDAANLVSPIDMNFHCEKCDAELVAESDKIATAEVGDGDSEETAKRRHREKLKDMLERLEVQLKPLQDHIAKLKELKPPDYGTFAEWQKRAIAAARAAGEGNDRSPDGETSRAGNSRDETRVTVELNGSDSKQGVKEDPASTKVLPPWMIRQGMNLTAAQRGEMKQEAGEMKPEPKFPVDEKDVKADSNYEAEYLKAYYEKYAMQQQEDEAPANDMPEVARQVGEKSKLPPDEDEEFEWEEDGPTAAPEAPEATTAPASQEGGEDDIEWE